MMEDKIISDVLMYLDGWELQNKSHKTRHKPNPRYLEPFNETSEEIEQNTNVRKTVTAKEILQMYDVAKIHVLNYIKRPVFPRTPVTHIAICMWTAGLLSQKARFRKQRVENSYNLINEAKKLLAPHVKHNPSISVISGKCKPNDCDIEYYRLNHHHNHRCDDKKHDCCKDHFYKGKKHHHIPPRFEYDEPEFDDFFLEHNHVKLKVLPVSGNIGDSITLKALVRDIYGNRMDDGIVKFYLESDEE